MKKVNYESEWDFVNDVAEDCIQKLDVEQREMLINHPRAIDYHFTYCMYIRNHYIHGTDFSDVPFYVEPDDLSAKVMKLILTKLLPEEYLYEDFFTEMLYGHRGFIKLRQEYKKLYGEYPVELVRKYRKEMSQEQIEEQVESISGETIDPEKWHNDFLQKYEKCKAVINCIIEELLEMVWCTEQFLKMASGCGVAYEEIFPKIEEMKQIFLEEGMYIPVEICLLPYEKQIGQERYLAYRNVLCEQLEDNPRLIEKLDEAYFRDRALAKVVLKYAWALEYLPMYQDDEEMVRYCLSQDGTAIEYTSKRFQESREWVKFAIEHAPKGTIMSLDCMKPYRKDKELVYLACRVKRWNFVYVDKKFRDDLELAKLCMEQTEKLNSIFSHLSKRLKGNKDLALLDLQGEMPDVKHYAKELRDDDEIAERLYELHGADAWGWYYMSERQKKKYGISEE